MDDRYMVVVVEVEWWCHYKLFGKKFLETVARRFVEPKN